LHHALADCQPTDNDRIAVDELVLELAYYMNGYADAAA